MATAETYICQFPDWYNAFGEKRIALEVGTRLTLKASTVIGGQRFIEFNEHSGLHFWADGFKPMRGLN